MKYHVLIIKQLLSTGSVDYNINCYQIIAVTRRLLPTFFSDYYKPDPMLTDFHKLSHLIVTAAKVNFLPIIS